MVIRRYLDVAFGYLATAVTYFGHNFDKALAIAIGLLSVGIMIIRFRREWRHKDE